MCVSIAQEQWKVHVVCCTFWPTVVCQSFIRLGESAVQCSEEICLCNKFVGSLHYICHTFFPFSIIFTALTLHYIYITFYSISYLTTFSSILVLMGYTCIAWEGSIETQTKAFKKKQSLVLVLVISENEVNLIQFEFVLPPLTLTSLIEVASPFNSIH